MFPNLFETVADNRKILHDQECEKMLILLLNHEDGNVQVAAAQALGVMSENLVSRDSIGMWGNDMFKHDNNNRILLDFILLIFV